MQKKPLLFSESFQGLKARWTLLFWSALIIGFIQLLDEAWWLLTNKWFWFSVLALVVIGGGYNAYKLNQRKTRTVTFGVDEAVATIMDDLRVECDLPSRSEVLRKAIQLLVVVSNSQQQGESIIIRKPDGSEVEILL